MRPPHRLIAVACALLLSAAASAWHGPGHQKATGAAVGLLDGRMPAFFIKGSGAIQHGCVDPDLFRLREFPALRAREAPDHFIDLELLKGAELPATRAEFITLCVKQGQRPEKVGFAPYAIVESTERLTYALAEHRKWPRNVHIQRKCLVYAGLLAHYAQDMCMPLHTTIHYDGRVDRDGKSAKSGIHGKVDALLGKVDVTRPEVLRGVKAAPFDALLPAVVAELKRSHAQIDRVYALEKRLPAVAHSRAPLTDDRDVAAFAAARMRACVGFTASLYLTAWRNSAKVQLPAWHQRDAVGR